ncbi:hypothetical protein R4B61_02625 [Fructilactobacillus vespulae]
MSKAMNRFVFQVGWDLYTQTKLTMQIKIAITAIIINLSKTA